MTKYLSLVCVAILSFAKMNAQCNNVNLAQGRPQSAAFGSATGDLSEPWRAFDTDQYAPQTRWGAGDTGSIHYVGIDLGTAYNICSIYLEMGSLDYATNLKIQGSNDLTSWTDLKSLPNNSQYALTIDNLPATGTYRYIRAYFLSRIYNWSYYTVYNFQVYNRVINDPPNVTLTAPSAGASYIQGTDINITANAADINGTISKVEFYQGTTKLGEDATAPYTYTWSSAVLGGYDISAKAIDNGGAFTWTDPVHITVSNAPSYLRNWTLTGNNLTNTNVGYVSIGGLPTNLPADTAIKLSVKGTIYAKKLTVTQTLWPDYVFEHFYKLRPLPDVEAFIKIHKHLPDVIPAADVEHNGVNVGDNEASLLRKVEELTLYIIDLNKKIERQQNQIQKIRRKLINCKGPY